MKQRIDGARRRVDDSSAECSNRALTLAQRPTH
jgi:hypothetical protein